MIWIGKGMGPTGVANGQLAKILQDVKVVLRDLK